MNYIYILTLLLAFQSYSQDFYASFDITYQNDMEKTEKSIEKVMGSMFDRTSQQSPIKDSLELATKRKEYLTNMISVMPMAIDLFDKDKSVAILIEDSTFQKINTHKNDSIHYGAKTKLSDMQNYYLNEELLLKVQEDSTDTKIINGYKCHKVYLNYVEDLEMPLDFSFTISSMYVTDEIEMLYHPVIKFKSILQKYYPLEVVISTQIMQGFETKYILKELKKS